MSGRFYFLQADDKTVYVLRFTVCATNCVRFVTKPIRLPELLVEEISVDFLFNQKLRAERQNIAVCIRINFR
jgi:hypothetical protein